MAGRDICIGDIHGCSAALAAILDAIDVRADDRVILLGDYCDRGHDTRGVFDLLIALRDRCNVVPVLGNHDELMLQARRSKAAFRHWLEVGGIVTLDSYGDSGRVSLIPAAHFAFLAACVPYYQTPTHLFFHAGYNPSLPLDRQDDQTLRWRSLADGIPAPHQSGRVAVVGHTPQADILTLDHLVALDTGCGVGGLLTALDVTSGDVWQADEGGRLRRRAGR